MSRIRDTTESIDEEEPLVTNENSKLLLPELLVLPNKKHRRNRSASMNEAISEVTHHSAMSRTLTDPMSDQGYIGDALRKEFQVIREKLGEHLQEADEDENFFLEMNLTKNLSILPEKKEIEQVIREMNDAFKSEEQIQLEEEARAREKIMEEEKKKKEPEVAPWSAYITLVSAVIALSSIGPFLKAQRNVSGEMKIVWRFQGTAIFLFPFAIRDIWTSGMPSLTFAQWGAFLMAASSYAVLCVAFAQSINYTTVANATILTNSQSILLIFGKMFVGSPVVFIEAFGVFVAFMGAILSAKESADAESTDEDALLSIWGDVLGLISSIGGIGYIVLGKSLRSTMPVLLFMVLNMTVASFLILLFMWVTEQDFSFNRHVEHGVWGWMNLQPDRLPLEIGTVFVCNVLGTMGYVRAFKHFSSVIIAVAALLEPVVAAFTAVLMGVGVLPGFEGWVGNALVIFGTLAVLYPTIERSKAAEKL